MAEAQDKKDIEFISPKQEEAELKKFTFKQWISGSVLAKSSFRRQLPFVIYLAFLGFLYIGNRYHAEKLTREINTLQRELDELRAESINTAAELMFFCRQSQVQKRINESGLGLSEAVAPPTKIKRYE
ncbi:MAG: FtsL-like putative cell division protein [Bacteroidales bacterium]|nr:FtsL-like putative cell division protein [Bacteroidales bacterium]HOK99579.1 FtsL-like putative cell division protein [Bacteroidales bacterium]HPO66428.1 FtsL-like putative cell division protein [Bacteroidales bacterium]